jgi:hypothetical protein
MPKLSKAFRLSEQATESLKWLVAQTGTTETAIVELSLAFLKHSLEIKKQAPEVKQNSPVPQKKKRKRH